MPTKITYRPIPEDIAFIDLREDAAVIERHQVAVHSKMGEIVLHFAIEDGKLACIEIHEASTKLPSNLLQETAGGLF